MRLDYHVYNPLSFLKNILFSGVCDQVHNSGDLPGIRKMTPTGNLEEGETLTCGVYSPSGHNFAVGTSYGAIYLGMMKKDPMQNNKTNAFMARVDTV